MIKEHNKAFAKARDQALDAHDRLRQHADAPRGSLGPFPDNLRQMEVRRLIDALKQLISLQFVYKNDAELQNAVANAEAYLGDLQIECQDEIAQHRNDVLKQYNEVRAPVEAARQLFVHTRERYIQQVMRGELFGVDPKYYHGLLDDADAKVDEALEMYPEDEVFRAVKDQTRELRALNEF
jgi:hypothetical protein